MKKCRVCSGDLVVGENITNARCKQYIWVCSPCWRNINNTNHRKRYNKLKKESQPGVYGIYYGDECLYVGESEQCELRFHIHKQTHPTKSGWIGLNKSYIKDYTQKIFKREEDQRKRRILEIELIVKHKPILNYPYREPGYIHE